MQLIRNWCSEERIFLKKTFPETLFKRSGWDKHTNELKQSNRNRNKTMIELTKTTLEDLETLFIFQTNKDGIRMAAFTAEDPGDKEAYMKKWMKIVANPDIRMQTIRFENRIVGSVIHFNVIFDAVEETHVSYWIDQQYWGKGLATEGLKSFIKDSVKRPLFARVAYDNYGSQKVLEKCGFKSIGKERGFARARNEEIEEFVYRFEL